MYFYLKSFFYLLSIIGWVALNSSNIFCSSLLQNTFFYCENYSFLILHLKSTMVWFCQPSLPAPPALYDVCNGPVLPHKSRPFLIYESIFVACVALAWDWKSETETIKSQKLQSKVEVAMESKFVSCLSSPGAALPQSSPPIWRHCWNKKEEKTSPQ